MTREIRVAGTDAGAECVKTVVLDGGGNILGRAVVPTRGYFQDCIQEAMGNAIEEARTTLADLDASYTTGFAASCAPLSNQTITETACHARAAFHHAGPTGTVVDLGGRDSKVIRLDAEGRPAASHSVRKCAVGIGTFLMFTARHLDVHPTRLMELAATAEKPASVGSYCTVFAEIEVIERLRQGAALGEIALGAMYSIADRILEVGGIVGPVTVTGGVSEYFPGVMQAMRELSGLEVEAVPEPILAGALGAALFALDAVGGGTEGRHAG